MKTKLLMLCVAVSSILNAQGDVPCKELFFSEILRHDTIMPNGKHYGSYAFEIFNPTPMPVSLTNYKMQLRKLNNTTHDILFSTSAIVPAKGTYVVSNTNAENTILAIANQDSTLLDSNAYCEAKLLKANGGGFNTVDVFGQPATMQQVQFNYLAFMLDPTYYSNTYGFPLNAINNIDIRRSYFVQAGIPTFTPIDVFGTWAFYFGGNFTNLGSHFSMCNAEALGVPVVGYQAPLTKTLNKLPAFGATGDLMPLNWQNTDGSFSMLNQNFTAGNAVNYIDIDFTNGSSCGNAQIPINCTGVTCTGFGSLFNGSRSKTVTMSTPSSAFVVDAATKSKIFTINGNGTIGLREYEYGTLAIAIYPTITSDVINVDGNIDCNYSITTVEGKTVQSGSLWNESVVNVGNLANGVYLITFKNYNGVKVDKFVKN